MTKTVSFIDNGDGTITDANNGLMWQKEDDDTEKNWDDLLSYCNNLSLAGHSDWRLPDIDELKSLIVKSGQSPLIDKTCFPNTKPSLYWSSTIHEVDPTRALVLYFNNGISIYYSKTDYYYIRCVRGGK